LGYHSGNLVGVELANPYSSSIEHANTNIVIVQKEPMLMFFTGEWPLASVTTKGCTEHRERDRKTKTV